MNLNSVRPAGMTSGASKLKSIPETRTTGGLAGDDGVIAFATLAPDGPWAKAVLNARVPTTTKPTMRPAMVFVDRMNSLVDCSGQVRGGDSLCRYSGPVSTGIRGYLSSRFNDAELMQYRWPVGPGPSSNTCPRCASHLAQRTSVRRMNSVRSDSVRTFSSVTGSAKLGP